MDSPAASGCATGDGTVASVSSSVAAPGSVIVTASVSVVGGGAVDSASSAVIGSKLTTVATSVTVEGRRDGYRRESQGHRAGRLDLDPDGLGYGARDGGLVKLRGDEGGGRGCDLHHPLYTAQGNIVREVETGENIAGL